MESGLSKNKIDSTKRIRETLEKDSYFFNKDMEEFIPLRGLKPISFDKYDILELWEDTKESLVRMQIFTEKGERVFKEFSDYEKAIRTLDLIKKYKKELQTIYSIEITSRLILWYSIFVFPYLDCSIDPSETDYSHFFRLKGEGKVEAIEALIENKGFHFYTLSHKLYKIEEVKLREQILKKLLKDPETLERLRTNTYVVPVDYLFVLETPQVYSAYNKLVLGNIPKQEFEFV